MQQQQPTGWKPVTERWIIEQRCRGRFPATAATSTIKLEKATAMPVIWVPKRQEKVHVFQSTRKPWLSYKKKCRTKKAFWAYFLSIWTHFGVMVGDHLMCVFKKRKYNAFTFSCMLTSWVCNVFESMSKYKSQAFHVHSMKKVWYFELMGDRERSSKSDTG